MNNKDKLKSKLAWFTDDKGFYIILMLCVFAIGISGYVLYSGPDTGSNDDYDISLEGGLPSSGEAQTVKPQGIPKADITFKDEEEPAEVQKELPEPAEEKTEQGRGEAAETWIFKRSPKYTFPVSGEVIRGFSDDRLLFDDTMGDWRTHCGVDLSCAEGDRVFAIADGSVTEVFDDPLMGTVIVLSHEDGLESRYCGLTPTTPISAGDSVVMGQEIGFAGNTNKSESAMACHLHFEVLQNGEYIDPMSLKYE
ncbi:MAG: M23 family metallopeptidase [Clostridia bacterium]|nr:M23 family metallopeptidase [Clostridia bacterium]